MAAPAKSKKTSSSLAKSLAPKTVGKKKGKAHKTPGPKVANQSKYRGQGR
jgi:hypothetical protein